MTMSSEPSMKYLRGPTKSMFVLLNIFIIVSRFSHPLLYQKSKMTRETYTAVNRLMKQADDQRQGEPLDLLGADRVEHDAREHDGDVRVEDRRSTPG